MNARILKWAATVVIRASIMVASCGVAAQASVDLQHPAEPDREPHTALLALAAAQTPQAPHKPARVALVLSGGGLRGLAHLGVLQVLEQQGLRPDLVVGTSVGAIIGGAYASGTPIKDLEALPLPAALDPWGSWLVTPSQRSTGLEQFVASQLAHQRMEDFPLRFVAVATARQRSHLAQPQRPGRCRRTGSAAATAAIAPAVCTQPACPKAPDGLGCCASFHVDFIGWGSATEPAALSPIAVKRQCAANTRLETRRTQSRSRAHLNASPLKAWFTTPFSSK